MMKVRKLSLIVFFFLVQTPAAQPKNSAVKECLHVWHPTHQAAVINHTVTGVRGQEQLAPPERMKKMPDTKARMVR